MSGRYILSPEAAGDLKDIQEYLVEQAGVRVARYVLRKLRDGMRFVAAHPEAGHLREDLTDYPVKFWPVFSYLIVYQPKSGPVDIVRVLHARQDVAAALDFDEG